MFALTHERFLIKNWAETDCSLASLLAQMIKNLPAMQETGVCSLGQKDPQEEGIATHSSILTCRSGGQWSLAVYSPWGLKK